MNSTHKSQELNFPQRSDEWFNARLSKITGSKIADLMPSEKARSKFTQVHLSKLMEIASENLTGLQEQIFPNKAMQWGIDHEDEAMGVLAFMLDKEIRQCGFFLLDDWTGASPDGIIDDEAIIEIKCPGSKKHLSYLLDSDNLLKDYKWQVYMEMYCTGLNKAYLMSYDPRYLDESKQAVIVGIECDPIEMDKLKSRIQECIELLEEWIK